VTVRLNEYSDRQVQANALSTIVANELRAQIELTRQATLCVAGGTTPVAFFEALAAEQLQWSRVNVLPTDERQVPESDELSNARLIRSHLLVNEAAPAQFVSLNPESASADQANALPIQSIDAVLPITTLVLGMGEDMHTASLFPGADQLEAALATTAPTLLAITAPGVTPARLTLTAPVLTASRHVHLLITGRKKLQALQTAMNDGPELLAPIRAILNAVDVSVHYAP
jgi:6-phosphogluconolactonase